MPVSGKVLFFEAISDGIFKAVRLVRQAFSVRVQHSRQISGDYFNPFTRLRVD